MASGTNQASLETSTDRHALLSVSFSFLATKTQKSVTGMTRKKRQNLLKKN